MLGRFFLSLWVSVGKSFSEVLRVHNFCSFGVHAWPKGLLKRIVFSCFFHSFRSKLSKSQSTWAFWAAGESFPESFKRACRRFIQTPHVPSKTLALSGLAAKPSVLLSVFFIQLTGLIQGSVQKQRWGCFPMTVALFCLR